MIDYDRPNIWDFLVWGVTVGWLGSFAIVKIALSGAINNTSDWILYFLVGIILGVIVGASNYSLKKAVFAIFGGLLAGFCCYVYMRLYLRMAQDFLLLIPKLFFWYAVAVIFFLAISDSLKEEFYKKIAPPIFTSLLAAIIISKLSYFLGIVAWVGVTYVGSSPQSLLIFFMVLALTLLNISININTWCKFYKIEKKLL